MANERRRMGGPRGGQMPVEKAKDFKGSIGKLFVYMKKYHAAVVVVILCAVASTLFSVIGPDILGKATTELANGLMAKIQEPAALTLRRSDRFCCSCWGCICSAPCSTLSRAG